ncbi:hypothetical protein M2161_004907 [Streptomyces sp. SAI-133]|uniref:hypothetical protein n=1 Tax=unclassified Streptomyces TaxID=2593676 RepID=UPI0024740967|nr:hypothetical protein [Streptomyces sp. SAI-133]MDH6585801.1 hypothetical protein [Streptomyces sp. SAI-133]
MTLSRLVLTSGRRVDLGELRLTSTYGGLLDGYPCRPVNELRIKGLLRSAEHDYPTAPVHLVPPPHEYPDHYPGAFGPVEMLPPVACVGVFRSTSLTPTRDPVLYGSHLTIIWFQPHTRIPSECDAQAGLREVAWEELARAYEL